MFLKDISKDVKNIALKVDEISDSIKDLKSEM